MHLQQIQFCYPINTQGFIQAATAPVPGVVPQQNIMIPATGASGGPSTQTQPQMYYQCIYSPGINEHTIETFFSIAMIYFSIK